jgi:hypothetical protein
MTAQPKGTSLARDFARGSFYWPFPGLRFASPGLFSFGPFGADGATPHPYLRNRLPEQAEQAEQAEQD